MKWKRKQANQRGKRKWSILRRSESELFLELDSSTTFQNIWLPFPTCAKLCTLYNICTYGQNSTAANTVYIFFKLLCLTYFALLYVYSVHLISLWELIKLSLCLSIYFLSDGRWLLRRKKSQKEHSLCSNLISSILLFFTAALSRGWMESPKTYPRSQLISLRMSLYDKAWKERKSSSTSGGFTKWTLAPAATGRNWCNSSLMTGGYPHLSSWQLSCYSNAKICTAYSQVIMLASILVFRCDVSQFQFSQTLPISTKFEKNKLPADGII